MKLLILAFFCGLVIQLCNAEVCLNTWNITTNFYSTGGTYMPNIKILEECMLACELDVHCSAINFDLRTSQPYCWLLQPTDTVDANGHDDKNINQYQINRNCTADIAEGCPTDWQQYPNTVAMNGVSMNYWTEYDCFTYCRYTSGCTAVDFDSSNVPPCSIHMGQTIVSSNSTPTAVQYMLNKTCPATQPLTTKIGRCRLQWFPNGTWCPPGKKIHIVNVLAKNNYLCCIKNADDAYPPDSSHIPTYYTSYVYPEYYQQILAACEMNTTCNIEAMTQENTDCLDSTSLQGNYVSIEYQCIVSADEELTTVRSTMLRRPTTAMSTSSATTATSPSNVASLAIERSNNNKLIIGLVVGLGVPVLLIIIVVVVLVVMKYRKRNQKEKTSTAEDHQIDRYYYHGSTAHRGAYPENQLNEISMDNDTM